MKYFYILLAIVAVFAGGFVYGDHVGSNAQLVKTQKAELATANGNVKALSEAAAQAKSDELANQAKARKATADHEQALSALQQRYDVLVAQRRTAGGLRDPNGICHPAAPGNKAAGTSGPDAPSTGTVQLSDGVTDHLYAMTKRADQLAEQLRGLQGWVKANGFYGDPDTKARVDKVELELKTARALIDAQVIELMEESHDTRSTAGTEG
jgi:hypothetical protein